MTISEDGAAVSDPSATTPMAGEASVFAVTVVLIGVLDRTDPP
jgi:hypothetical protein